MFFHKYYYGELTGTSSFLLTHGLSITTGSEQTITTILQFLIFNKKTAKHHMWPMQIFIQLSNEYSYKSRCWPNVTSQSQTSHTVKRTSNSLIWGELLYQLLIHRHYESTQLTVRLTLITKNTFTDSELVRNIKLTAQSRCHNRKIDRTIFTYILTKLLEHSTPRQTYKLPCPWPRSSVTWNNSLPDISKNRSGTETINSTMQHNK